MEKTSLKGHSWRIKTDAKSLGVQFVYELLPRGADVILDGFIYKIKQAKYFARLSYFNTRPNRKMT